MKWTTGPLGFPATEDWKYWTPHNIPGWVAIFMPTGLPGPDTIILADDVPTQAEAQAICEEHAKKQQ